MNLQVCARQIFVGVNDSWEQFFQAVRRSWRFGQKNPSTSTSITASTEGNVLENLKRKERQAEEMAEEMLENMQELTRMNLRGTNHESTHYERESTTKDGWEIHLADCVDLAREIPSIQSLPIAFIATVRVALHTYSTPSATWAIAGTPINSGITTSS